MSAEYRAAVVFDLKRAIIETPLSRQPALATPHVILRGVWLFVANLATVLASYGATAFVARRLGQADFGDYSFALATGALFATVANFGLDRVVVRQASQRTGHSGRLLGAAIVTRISLSVVAALLALLVGTWFGTSARLAAVLALCVTSLLISQVSELPRALLFARGEMGVDAAVRFWGRSGMLISVWAAILRGYGIVGVSVGLLGSALLEFAAYAWAVRRDARGALSARMGDCVELVKASLPLALNTVLVVLYFRINIILLRNIRGAEEAGWFAAAFSFLQLFQLVSGTVVGVALPVLSKQALLSRNDLRATVATVTVDLLATATGCALLMSLFAENTIALIYGPRYAPSATALTILAWAIVPMFAGNLFSTGLIATGRRSALIITPVVALVVSALMNLCLVAAYGQTGAAVATLITEWVVAGLMLVFTQRTVGSIRLSTPMLKLAVCALATLLTAFLARHLPWVLRALIVSAIYVLTVVLMGVRPFSDWLVPAWWPRTMGRATRVAREPKG